MTETTIVAPTLDLYQEIEYKFGYNEEVDTASVPADVWDGGDCHRGLSCLSMASRCRSNYGGE